MRKIIERKHRLPAEEYRGRKVVSFTVCIEDRGKLFVNDSIIADFESLLLDAFDRFQCRILVYLFMPDHLHLLVEGICDESDPLKALRSFKQRTGYQLARGDTGMRWQKDCFDHILKSAKAIPRHVRYILANPVRARLVECWKEYRWRGSTAYNLDAWNQI